MAKQVQLRRGSTVDHNAFTGALGETTVDTAKDTVVVHDGSTAGGFPLAREDMSNVANTIGIAQLSFADGTSGQVLSTDGNGTLSFIDQTAAAFSVGGDLTGTVANAQIAANTINVAELNVVDSTANSVLTTNGSGTLVFRDLLTEYALGGDLSGTINNAQIVANSVGSLEIAANAVTASKIAANSVTNIKISDATITDEKIIGMDASKLSGTTLPALNGAAVTHLPYDLGFVGGYDTSLVAEDLEVGTYGHLVMARSGTIEGEAGYMDVAATTQPVICDIEKNGISIYTGVNKPFFAQDIQKLSNGTIDSNLASFVSGDRITFKVTQIGTGTVGQGLRFTLRCRV